VRGAHDFCPGGESTCGPLGSGDPKACTIVEIDMFIHDAVRDVIRHLRYGWLVATRPKAYTYNGLQIPLAATQDLQRSRKLIFRGLYEREEIAAIETLVKADDVVLELGGGCGIVSSFVAKRLIYSQNLHVIEANGRLIESIKSVASANSIDFEVHNLAVSSEGREGEFYVSDDFLSSSVIDRGTGAPSHAVKFVALRDLIRTYSPTLLIVDVEGAEQDLFDEPLPPYVRALCIEIHPHIIGDAAASAVVRNIMNQGFEMLIDSSSNRTFSFQRLAA
jgi:FkbM family methyltransferase